MLDKIREEAALAARELLDAAELKKGDILVVGCSSSEIVGEKIGKGSSEETAKAVFGAIYEETSKRGIFLAAQCCEHLNRAIIIEEECAEKYGLEKVSAVPFPKAGGSFASAAYRNFVSPTAVEFIKAHAGIDIGGTLIGMHLRSVAVPVRLSISRIGQANIICARTRPKYIGGERTHYTL
ncbi:MAG: TIGR01440 family protein [Clostridia bacterium]|nr:TIGR01440 family protein [Clostridia bacterium]